MTFVEISTTFETEAEANELARNIVKEKLAACVQVSGPVTSSYLWQGKVETEKEWVCLIKTQENLYSQVENFIKDNHPYDTPQILCLPILKGSTDYLDWVKDSTT